MNDPVGAESDDARCHCDSVRVGTTPEGKEDLIGGHENRVEQPRRPHLARPAYRGDCLLAAGNI